MCHGTYPVQYLPIHPTSLCLSVTGWNSSSYKTWWKHVQIVLPESQNEDWYFLDTQAWCLLTMQHSGHTVPKLQGMCNAFSVSCNLIGSKRSAKKMAHLLQMAPHMNQVTCNSQPVLWNRTVDWLKTSFHPLLWTSSGLRDSWKTAPYLPSTLSPFSYPSDPMKSKVVDESLSSINL